MKDKKRNVIMISIAILIMILAVAGATYAYFTATIANGDKGSSIIIKTGTLSILYTDTEYINVSGVLPGDNYSKVVTVTNEGNVPANYHLVWINLINELATRNDLTMEISCSSNTDTCDGLSNTVVSESGTNIPLLYNVEIGMLETHTYTIILHFNETGSNQNDNQGKIISGKIGILEARDLAINLYGYVLNNGEPMANTLVELHSDPISVLTDSEGRYEMDNVPLGAHTLYLKTSDGSSIIDSKPLSIRYSEPQSFEFPFYDGFDPDAEDPTVLYVNQYVNETGLEVYTGVYNEVRSTGYGQSIYTVYSIDPSYEYKNSVTSIVFEKGINVPGNAIDTRTLNGNTLAQGTVGYLLSDGSSGYVYHIQSDHKIRYGNGSNMISNYNNLVSISGLENISIVNKTDTNNLFYNNPKLTTIDIGDFDVSLIKSLSGMFYNDAALTTMNLSTLNTVNLESMQLMFQGCTSLTSVNFGSINTDKLTSMLNMFAGATSLTSVDLSNFNTTNVTNMQTMFQGCTSLTTVNLRNFVKNPDLASGGIFYGAKNGLNVLVSNSTIQSFINAKFTESSIVGGTATIG